MISGMRSWWSSNVNPQGNDFQSKAAPKAAVYGGAIGAALGAGYGAYNVSQDKPYWATVTDWVPKGELGPNPDQIFGPHTEALLREVKGRSSGAGSADSTMRYMAYVSSHSQISPESMASLYNTLENHFSDDAQVRSALNLVAAYVEKHPDQKPFQAAALLLNEANGRSFASASQSFQQRYGLTQQDLEQATERQELRHTAMLGRFGYAGGIAIGAAGGAAIGIGVGVAFTALARVATSE